MNKKKHSAIRTIILVAADTLSVILSLLFAFLITAEDKSFRPEYLIWIGADLVVTIVVFALFGLYSMILSSVSILDGIKISLGVISIGLANVILAAILGNENIGIGTAMIFTALLFYFAVFIRFHKRILHIGRYILVEKRHSTRNVMIVGAGAAGQTLIREMQTSDKIALNPVCVVDDDVEKQGKFICGVKIAGSTFNIKKLCEDYDVQEIFVALPSVDKKVQSRILTRCNDAGCPVKILPGTYQLLNGQISVSSMKDVDIQDLLGRDEVNVDIEEIMSYIENKVVLVTGGGGSIGSELCRQIATHRPRQLIILDIYENNAYDIEQELKRRYPSLNLLTLIASVRDGGKMKSVFEKYAPQIVFHAAAHKHVPLMETSPNEAVKNNVFGTLNVARLADNYKAEVFVQISTDKAVNPTNVMGATKRICEMIVQTIGKHSEHTKFVAVRFGNVLGSNGSVIPLFKKQIAEGGPVTVTHKDIIRYFMTIPEAVSLVLQAGAYAKGGQIFVLDMGEPVRIYGLAYNLIKLSGLEPNVDIEIKCTGLRPGEKLYEERLMDEEGMQKTPNGLINIAQPIKFDENTFWQEMDELYLNAYDEYCDIRPLIKKLVPTYVMPSRK